MPGNNHCTIDWGDGSAIETVTDINPTHVYPFAWEYDVSIGGAVSIWNFEEIPISKDSIIEVKQWGKVGFVSAGSMFKDCSKLKYITANDSFGFGLTDFSYMVANCVVLECIMRINTLTQNNTLGMFDSTLLLQRPNSTEQAAIMAGDDWVNDTDCPPIHSPEFITTWRVPSPQFGNKEIIYPARSGGVIDFIIDWGDGSPKEHITENNPKHTYAEYGNYDISIDGICEKWGFYDDFGHNDTLIAVKQWGDFGVLTLEGLFADCSDLETLTENGTFGSGYTDFSSMFQGCTELQDCTFSFLDVSQAVTFNRMFLGCSTLVNISFPTWDTSNVTDFYRFMGECQYLKTLDLSNFDTSNATTMNSMFYDCFRLTTLDVSNFNTSKVTDFYSMFLDVKYYMTYLDISNFDLSNATDFSFMFDGCRLLTHINSKFNTINGESFINMFDSCNDLICIPNINTLKQTDTRNMFQYNYDLQRPNSSEQSAIMAGDDWVNTDPCL
jgi:surface protein